MAQTGYTPILIYSSSTAAAAPTAGNLTNSTLGSELAINITDGKLFYKDDANAVQVIGWKTVPVSAGGTGLTSLTANGILYASGTSSMATGSALTFDGTNFATTGSATATAFIPSSSVVPTNGMFLPAANTLAFSTNTTERGRFDSSGRLLIGVTSVRSGFSYSIFNEALGSPTAGAGFIQNSANTAGPAVSFGKTRGTTVGSVTSISGGDVFGQLLFSGADGTGMISGASILAVSDGTPATNAMPGRLVFNTTASGASSVTERMRIDSNGFVGVGVTSPAARLHLGGAITASSWTTNGIGLRYAAATYTDSSTAASGTVASSGIHAFAQPTIAASNATVTYTNAATLYVANSPANGTNVTVTNPLSLWVDNGTTRLDGNITYGGLQATQAAAPTVASAATIAPTTPILFVSGTTTISTITAPAPISSGGGEITLIPTGLWATNTAGNIALASTAVVNRALTMTYDATTTKWYPSY